MAFGFTEHKHFAEHVANASENCTATFPEGKSDSLRILMLYSVCFSFLLMFLAARCCWIHVSFAREVTIFFTLFETLPLTPAWKTWEVSSQGPSRTRMTIGLEKTQTLWITMTHKWTGDDWCYLQANGATKPNVQYIPMLIYYANRRQASKISIATKTKIHYIITSKVQFPKRTIS